MIEVLTAEATRKLDKAAIENWGIPSILLMENAVFSILKYFKDLDNILIVCGTGNNGGDGLALARHLFNQNKTIKIFVISDTDNRSNDFNINFNILNKLPVDICLLKDVKELDSLKSSLERYKVVVDCIFGTGLSREIKGIHLRTVEEINKANNYKISIDVPSGVCADRGIPLGDAIIADKTITFQTLKKGFLNYEALKYIGQLNIEPIGIPIKIVESVSESIKVLEETDIKKLVPIRKKYAHKGNFGKICIIAGNYEYSGAAYLTTEAAVKTGSGLVNLYTSKTLEIPLRSKLSEAMVRNYEDENELKNGISKADVIIFGPGLGTSKEILLKLELILKIFKGKLLIDADGINILKDNLHLLHKCECEIIMTPHPGEMSRLTGGSIEYINENRLEVAREFSKKYGVVLLLKGLNTVITNGINTFINPTGSSAMAAGGMGDTLSGIIGSLMGQGINILDAAKLGAYLHGYVGDCLAKDMYSVDASEIVKNIPIFLKKFTLKTNK